MTLPYTHLTQEERYQIYAYKKAGYGNTDIGLMLDRNVSTIKRELARNHGLKGYRPQQAQRLAQARHQLKAKMIKMTLDMKQHIRERLSLEWSPEQIYGRLKMDDKTSVCPQTIYAFIARDKASGGSLHQHLRHKKYRKRTGSTDARGRIRNRVDIDLRPTIVDQKTRIGDWEADTVIGKGHKGVLVTLTERYSKLNLIAHVPSKQANVVTQALIDMLKPYAGNLETITFDNGKEFAYHEQLVEEYGVNTYFAHPYSSWERGLNENHNGLIRQYLPKGQALNKVTSAQIIHIQNRLNHRPRKLLGYKTPQEVYTKMALAA